ncbi:MAG: hypothetical protein KBA66_15860 [Leptospiraceae bacterium]|nr:hypothetical protein [Leptospiraceae bacterium]
MKKSKGIKLSHDNKNVPHWSERPEKNGINFNLINRMRHVSKYNSFGKRDLSFLYA